MMHYTTEIELGAKYRDTQTGLEGTAIAVTFWQYACERVIIELTVDGKLEEYTFDAPRLVKLRPAEKPFEQKNNGGPGGSATGRAVTGRSVGR